MTRPKRTTRTYSDEIKAAALALLAANGGSARRASRQLTEAGTPVPQETIRGWAAQPISPVPVDLVEQAKKSLDELLAGVVNGIAQGLSQPAAINRIVSQPHRAASVLATVGQELRLLRGQATEITEHRTLSGFLATAKWLEPSAQAETPAQPETTDAVLN